MYDLFFFLIIFCYCALRFFLLSHTVFAFLYFYTEFTRTKYFMCLLTWYVSMKLREMFYLNFHFSLVENREKKREDWRSKAAEKMFLYWAHELFSMATRAPLRSNCWITGKCVRKLTKRAIIFLSLSLCLYRLYRYVRVWICICASL